MITHGCAREEREAGAQGVQVSSDSVRTVRSSEFETSVVSTWQLRIKQVSTCWKDNFKCFPMDMGPATGSLRTGRGDRNKSTVVSASFQIKTFQVRQVRDMIDFDPSPMLDVPRPLYTLVIREF